MEEETSPGAAVMEDDTGILANSVCVCVGVLAVMVHLPTGGRGGAPLITGRTNRKGKETEISRAHHLNTAEVTEEAETWC